LTLGFKRRTSIQETPGLRSSTMATAHPAGYGTEYSDNFCQEAGFAASKSRQEAAFVNQTNEAQPSQGVQQATRTEEAYPQLQYTSEFPSQQYPGILRETIVRKDERGHYIDPFKNLVSKPSGRLLMHDETHTEKMYASQWSSELADNNGPYSFPTTTELPPEIPFNKDLQWKANGEAGQWPTELWKHWRSVAMCPNYDGHDDQVEYSKYKISVP